MKYLFVIYTDLNYKEKLKKFKEQIFYKEICNDLSIEIIEWGKNEHTDYCDLHKKTSDMIKWCYQNKKYDFLIKCDDSIFDEKWIHYFEKLNYKEIFINDNIENKFIFAENDPTCNNNIYGVNYYWKNGLVGSWKKINKIDNNYRGINLLNLKVKDWINFENVKNIKLEIKNIENIPFFEGKFYIISRKFSKFIIEFIKNKEFEIPIEDYMIGKYYTEFIKNKRIY